MKKTLVAFYSKDGNTRKIAELLKSKLNADLYEITTSRHYNSDDWIASEEALKEIQNNDLPPITSPQIDLSPYNIILLGGPVWGQTLATTMMSYLRENTFERKKVSAFWTFYDHDENYNKTMKEMVTGGEYISGLPMPRDLVNDFSKLDTAIQKWLELVKKG